VVHHAWEKAFRNKNVSFAFLRGGEEMKDVPGV